MENVADSAQTTQQIVVPTKIDGRGLIELVVGGCRARAKGVRLRLCVGDRAQLELLQALRLTELVEFCESARPVEPDKPFARREWAGYLGPVSAAEAPEGVALNLIGRKTTGPFDGFGQLWLKTYTANCGGHPRSEVTDLFKNSLAELWPEGNTVRFPPGGIAPGAVGAIKLHLTGAGSFYTGVRVLHSDAESFTFATLEGHMATGWINFSVYDAAGISYAAITSLARTADPVFDAGYRLFGYREQENFWKATLAELSLHLGVTPKVDAKSELIDSSIQLKAVAALPANGVFSSLFARASRFLSQS